MILPHFNLVALNLVQHQHTSRFLLSLMLQQLQSVVPSPASLSLSLDEYKTQKKCSFQCFWETAWCRCSWSRKLSYIALTPETPSINDLKLNLSLQKAFCSECNLYSIYLYFMVFVDVLVLVVARQPIMILDMIFWFYV